MASLLPFLLIGTFAAIFITIAVISYKRHQERVAALFQLAASKGWQYSAFDPYNLPARWGGPPFDEGYARTASNVVSGEIGGRPMVAFDYSYKEDSSNSKGQSSTTTYTFGVCALRLPCPLPELHVAPEGLFSRLGQALGMSDIELESEDFNRRYRVRCPDPKLASDVLPPRTMELLLQAPQMRFRFAGTDVICWDSGHLEPYSLLEKTAILCGVIDNVPSFVWKDRSG